VASVPAISVRDVWVEFGSTRVLEGIDFEVAAGELVCIVGPSGCGKSTLLNVIGGFLVPTRGEVTVQGEPVRGPDRRRIFVFQDDGVFPWLTVEENVAFGLSRASADERRRTVAHYVERVGLRGFERAWPRQLSGGMRQRVEIARALAANPDVLYMDEPFGALDYLTRLKMRADLLEIWRRERKTILFVTHDIEEAVQLADRVFVMTQRPATMRAVVPVELARPRDFGAAAYLAARHAIFAAMGVSEATGVEPPPRATAAPAPSVDASVVVIGGGPAGSILASYLGGAGIDHVVLDRVVHPRRHVGESLVCSTTRVFGEIGFLEQLETSGFVRKHGAVFTLDGGRRELALPFRAMPDLGIDQAHTYHVDRARFDELLLAHAATRGARIEQGSLVERVDLDERGAALHVAGRAAPLSARIVADASGRATLLGRQLRTRRGDPRLAQIAVHGWFTGVDRGPAETADWIHIHVLREPRAWAWQIPISADVTSIGVVCEGRAGLARDETGERFFARQIAAHPLLARRMAKALALHGGPQVEGAQSYFGERLAGPGWLALGDAAQFVDPVFSSGVSVAAESARLAARALAGALSDPAHAAEHFADYDQTVRRGGEVWRELILLFYRMPPLFLSLLEDAAARPALQSLLQGRVYEPRDLDVLAELHARALELERAAASS